MRPLFSLFLGSLTALLLATAACGEEEPPIEPTYENVVEVIDLSCTFMTSCHGGSRGKAGLIFAGADDKTTVLNGVTSCQYDRMPRVDPGDPDNSWLMVKIDGMYDDDGMIQFTPESGWTSTATDPDCQDFGTLMPNNATPVPLPMRQVELFREWIRLGAPGPSGG
jgi:hypothetical protein